MMENLKKLKKSLLKTLYSLENINSTYDYVKVSIASPKRIKQWVLRNIINSTTIGKVTSWETYSYKHKNPVPDGLFCEKIFGPVNSWKCFCGRLKGIITGTLCGNCYVEFTDSKVRRHRMGYIELLRPVLHPWYTTGKKNYLTIFLSTINHSTKFAQRFSETTVIGKFDSDFFSLNKNYLVNRIKDNISFKETFLNLNKKEFKLYEVQYSTMEYIKFFLESLDLKTEIYLIRSLVYTFNSSNHTSSGYNKNRQQHEYNDNKEYDNTSVRNKTINLLKKLRILESFYYNKINPAWLILSLIPVIPPILRGVIFTENNSILGSDINEFYQNILQYNLILTKVYEQGIDTNNSISYHGHGKVNDYIHKLFDGSSKNRMNDNSIVNLASLLKSKEGQLRSNVLGKRVDYSGRSVITVNSQIKLNECVLPFELAKKIFEPFIFNSLAKVKIENISFSSIANFLNLNIPLCWYCLKIITKKYSVLLNRAPTLHKYGIQTFNPTLSASLSIQIHPLVCSGFNADFDGDQMAVHLPVYSTSQLEAKSFMVVSENLFTPLENKTILKPAQDMVIGCYYLAIFKNSKHLKEHKIFLNKKEILLALNKKEIELHSTVLLKENPNHFQFAHINNSFYLINLINIFNNAVKLNIKYIFKKKLTYILITNVGILFLSINKFNQFAISNLILETTPGFILLKENFNLN